MGLDALMNRALAKDVSDDQGPWRQFILDHALYIKKRSYETTIDPTVMNVCQYDLQRFLSVYMRRNTDMAWIVRQINSLPNDMHFENISVLFVPSDELISKLYLKYLTVSQNEN